MFSIIIPTYNRAHILEKSLPIVMKMKGVKQCEIFIVDDGSSDNTSFVLEKFKHNYPNLIKIIKQQNKGPAEARNSAIKQATKARILFLDDDVFPDESLLLKHFHFLDSNFSASQGILNWHPCLADNKVITFMDSQKMQFSFDLVKENNEISYLNVYTANLAVEKKIFSKCGLFDNCLSEDNNAKRYGFEDTALAYRIKKEGYKIGLNRSAMALHLHPITEEKLINRSYKVGYSSGILLDKYPEIAKDLKIKQKTLFSGLQGIVSSCVANMTFMKKFYGYNYWLRIRCKESYLRGFNDYKKDNK